MSRREKVFALFSQRYVRQPDGPAMMPLLAAVKRLPFARLAAPRVAGARAR